MEFDLQNANVGKQQTVQLTGLSATNQIKIFVAVLDSSDPFTYTITITEQASVNTLCTIPSKQLIGAQYCSNCNGEPAKGAYCEAE